MKDLVYFVVKKDITNHEINILKCHGNTDKYATNAR